MILCNLTKYLSYSPTLHTCMHIWRWWRGDQRRDHCAKSKAASWETKSLSRVKSDKATFVTTRGEILTAWCETAAQLTAWHPSTFWNSRNKWGTIYEKTSSTRDKTLAIICFSLGKDSKLRKQFEMRLSLFLTDRDELQADRCTHHSSVSTRMF